MEKTFSPSIIRAMTLHGNWMLGRTKETVRAEVTVNVMTKRVRKSFMRKLPQNNSYGCIRREV